MRSIRRPVTRTTLYRLGIWNSDWNEIPWGWMAVHLDSRNLYITWDRSDYERMLTV